MRIKSLHIALLVALTFLLAPPRASALGVKAPPCPDGELFRRVGTIVCINRTPTRDGKAVVPRRSERNRFNQDQERNYTKVRNIIAKPKPFARRVTDKRTSRARRAAAFANYRSNSNVDFTARSRALQKTYHESRRR